MIFEPKGLGATAQLLATAALAGAASRWKGTAWIFKCRPVPRSQSDFGLGARG